MDKEVFERKEAVLFDFEGTLVDFQWDLAGAVKETFEMLRAFGFPTDRLQSKKYSTLMREAMELASEIGQSPDEVRDKIGAVYDRFDEDALLRWTLRPGAKDLLNALKKKRIRTGLVTNVGKRALARFFLRLDLKDLFGVVVTRNDVKILKPGGEGINLALSRLDVDRERALFIGDSLDDVHAAREAGVEVIILLGGENRKPDLLLANPDLLIQGFDELIACL